MLGFSKDEKIQNIIKDIDKRINKLDEDIKKNQEIIDFIKNKRFPIGEPQSENTISIISATLNKLVEKKKNMELKRGKIVELLSPVQKELSEFKNISYLLNMAQKRFFKGKISGTNAFRDMNEINSDVLSVYSIIDKKIIELDTKK